jgi:peptidoglycan hydrolase-like protein with peptidoglycan-binding domain
MPVNTPPPPVLRPARAAELRRAPASDSAPAFTSPSFMAPSLLSTNADTAEEAVAAGDIIERGDQGDAVRDVQSRLRTLGYSMTPDGNFGPYTESKVQEFQRHNGISPTGKIGPTTLLGLRVKEAMRPDIAISKLFPSVGPGRHLGPGARGIEVETLQRLLTVAGYDVEVDGKFGPATTAALQDFQRDHYVSQTGVLGPTTLSVLDQKIDARGVNVVSALNLPNGYGSLEKLAQELTSRDGRFNANTRDGRSALALALAIGGTEVYGQHTTGTDFFTRLGGTGNRMLGFAQFNLDYHAYDTATPQRYTNYLADILTGKDVMPNSGPASDHVRALSDAIANGQVDNGYALRLFMHQRGFGGSNWQGIDDGWHRAPGLADALVDFIQAAGSSYGQS